MSHGTLTSQWENTKNLVGDIVNLQVNEFYSSSQAGNFNTSPYNGSMNSEYPVICC